MLKAHLPIMLLWLAFGVVYLVTVRLLRYARRSFTSRKYEHLITNPGALGQMTLQDAFDIQQLLVEQEFPITFAVSIFFALFKTYGIPSISQLLSRTGELAGRTTASKRAADTGVLLTEIVLNRPGTDRNLASIARMNWLHGLYRRSGKIRDDDMLYTLSLFALEPIRWTRRLEWRELTDLECCALALYWKNMGDVMDISYERLPSFPSGWANALEWMRELEAWSEGYEAENMMPEPLNRTVANATIIIGLTNVPSIFRPLVTQFAASLLNPRLRRAMLFEEPPVWVSTALELGISLRKLFVRHLLPPRPWSMRALWFTDADPRTGNFHAAQYVGHPWYVEPTLRRRWNLNSWLLWLSGGYVPSSSTPEYRPEGYEIQKLGPVQFEGKGLEEMKVARDAILKLQGCPFHAKTSS